jgi:hypothetical protein
VPFSILQGDPVGSEAVFRITRAAGVSPRTLERPEARLGAESRKQGIGADSR